jgi:hypothetical protein
MEKALGSYDEYQRTATVDSILRQTADATAAQVEAGAAVVTGAAGKGLRWLLGLVPWWGWAGASVAVVVLFFPGVLFRAWRAAHAT